MAEPRDALIPARWQHWLSDQEMLADIADREAAYDRNRDYARDVYHASQANAPISTSPLHHERTANMSLADVLKASYGRDVEGVTDRAIAAREKYGSGSLFPGLSFTKEDVFKKHPVTFQTGRGWEGRSVPVPGSGIGKPTRTVRGFAPRDLTESLVVGLAPKGGQKSGTINWPMTGGEAGTTTHELRHRALQHGQQNQSLKDYLTDPTPYWQSAPESMLGKMSKTLKGQGERSIGGRPASWVLSPYETDARLGGLKALYKRETGKEITNEDEGRKAWRWYEDRIKKPWAAELYSREHSLPTPEEMKMWKNDPNWKVPAEGDELEYERQFHQRLPQLMKNEPRNKDIWQQLIS